MAKTMIGSMQVKAAWTLTDSPTGAGNIQESPSVDATKSYTSGVGDAMVNLRWVSSRSLAGSSSETLDLTALAESITGKDVTREFINIKEILVVNDSTANALRVGAAATNVFLGPLAGTAPTQKVARNSRLLWEDYTDGFDVDSTHKNLKIENLGGTTTAFRVVILGVDEAGIIESSSSSEE